MGLSIIVLAAGQGRRMRSSRPKVLADLAGRPMLAHVLDRARQLEPDRIRVVVGHGADAVRATLPEGIEAVEQPEQRGTGDAVACALGGLAASDTALILCGDVPLTQADTLRRLVDAARRSQCGVLTVEVDDPTGYGRIVRSGDGSVARIVEERDATEDERGIREVNTGLLAMRTGPLASHVAGLDRDNAQGEYYLTDVIGRVAEAGGRIECVHPAHAWEVQGVNSRAQLASLERAWQRHLADGLMAAGVTLRDPARIDIRGTVEAGPDSLIDVGCVFEGDVRIAEGAEIGAHCVLRDAVVGPGARIHPHSVIEGAQIGQDCQVGPFARVRPGCELSPRAKIGNFVETKQARVGPGSKINHLAYVGDAELGAGVNVGAGVITCNYDGRAKHRTVIDDGAFIGSDCQLVAPVSIGARAVIGAGSTITRDAPAEQLTLSRTKQKSIANWVHPADRSSSADDGD